jgi:hypothetical protein
VNRIIQSIAVLLVLCGSVFAQIINVTDPTTNADPNDQFFQRINMTGTGAHNSPNFSNEGAFGISYTALNGWNYDHPYQKLTHIPFSISALKRGASQFNGLSINLVGGGMADLLGQYTYVDMNGAGNYAGADEGAGVCSWQIHQGQSLARSTITKITQSNINGPIPFAITPALAPQVCMVPPGDLAVSGWANIGDESVQATAVDAVSFTARFNRAHAAGDVVSGAVVVQIARFLSGFGQGRLLVNLTQPQYTTGTAMFDATSHGPLGVGTSWAGLGGAFSFRADDAIAPDGETVCAWYPISKVSDDTHCTILRRDAVGIGTDYLGLGKVQGAYTIAPAAVIRAIDYGHSSLILAPGGTWTVNDTIEAAWSVNADVTALNLRYGMSLVGGRYRSGFNLYNDSKQQFDSALLINGTDNKIGIESSGDVGIVAKGGKTAAIQLGGNYPNIVWQGQRGILQNGYGTELALADFGVPTVLGTPQQGKIRVYRDPVASGLSVIELPSSVEVVRPGPGTSEVHFSLAGRRGGRFFIQPVYGTNSFQFQVRNDTLSSTAIEFGAFDDKGVKLAFYGGTPVKRPVVTGKWSDGTAAKSFFAALVSLNLVQDQTAP